MKTSFKVFSMLSVMAILSGCPDKGGGGGGQVAAPVATTTGIVNGECTQPTIAAYFFIKNSTTSTDIQQVKNACANLNTLTAGQQCRVSNQNLTVSTNDIQYKCNMANNVGGNTNYPGYPNQPGQNIQMKNLVCSIEVANGTAAGSVTDMPVQVFANGADLNLYANMENTKSYVGGYFNITRRFSSEKLAMLKLKFKAGQGTVADTLSLSAQLRNGKSASVSGFAGSEVRIEITPDYEQDTLLIVSCAGQDNFNAGAAINGQNLKCMVKENDNGKITRVMVLKPASEFEMSGVKPIRSSNLEMTSPVQNSLSINVSPSSTYESYRLVSGLTTPSTMKIQAPGYSLESSCVRQ